MEITLFCRRSRRYSIIRCASAIAPILPKSESSTEPINACVQIAPAQAGSHLASQTPRKTLSTDHTLLLPPCTQPPAPVRPLAGLSIPGEQLRHASPQYLP